MMKQFAPSMLGYAYKYIYTAFILLSEKQQRRKIKNVETIAISIGKEG
jgi:uncharacterized membrane protein